MPEPEGLWQALPGLGVIETGAAVEITGSQQDIIDTVVSTVRNDQQGESLEQDPIARHGSSITRSEPAPNPVR